jgi:hypothetical protein
MVVLILGPSPHKLVSFNISYFSGYSTYYTCFSGCFDMSSATVSGRSKHCHALLLLSQHPPRLNLLTLSGPNVSQIRRDSHKMVALLPSCSITRPKCSVGGLLYEHTVLTRSPMCSLLNKRFVVPFHRASFCKRIPDAVMGSKPARCAERAVADV